MLPVKDPEESVVMEFDFSDDLPEVLSAIVSITVEDGEDLNFTSILDGSAQIKGTSVYQRLSHGVHEVLYKVRCEASYGVNVAVQSDLLYVKTR